MPMSRIAFRELFEAHRDAVHRFLCRVSRNRSDADDLLQETFLAVWRKRDQFRGDGSHLAYLRRTDFRLYLNRRERRERRRALAPLKPGEPTPLPHDVADASEARAFLVDRVREALAALPDGPREAFIMFRFEGMPCREVAEVTDTNVKTVETRIRRATTLLEATLAPLRPLLPVP